MMEEKDGRLLDDACLILRSCKIYLSARRGAKKVDVTCKAIIPAAPPPTSSIQKYGLILRF